MLPAGGHQKKHICMVKEETTGNRWTDSFGMCSTCGATGTTSNLMNQIHFAFSKKQVSQFSDPVKSPMKLQDQYPICSSHFHIKY